MLLSGEAFHGPVRSGVVPGLPITTDLQLSFLSTIENGLLTFSACYHLIVSPFSSVSSGTLNFGTLVRCFYVYNYCIFMIHDTTHDGLILLHFLNVFFYL